MEDAIDQLPAHNNYGGASEALHLRHNISLYDGWRECNPHNKSFFYRQKATRALSRIDRIYASRDLVSTALDWDMKWTAISTDHKMVSIRVVDKKIPFIGKGRWTIATLPAQR